MLHIYPNPVPATPTEPLRLPWLLHSLALSNASLDNEQRVTLNQGADRLVELRALLAECLPHVLALSPKPLTPNDLADRVLDEMSRPLAASARGAA